MSQNNVSPTEKQISAVNEVISGQENLGEAMRTAGYSDKTSLNPKQNFVDSRGVKAYLETLDEKAQKKFSMSIVDKALETYMNALEATKIVPVRMTQQNGLLEYRIGKEPDHHTRIAAADRIIKIYGADKIQPLAQQPHPNFELDSKEIRDWNKEFLEFIETRA